MRRAIAAFLVSLAAAVSAADNPAAIAAGSDFALPLFTREGYRSLTLRGSEVRSMSGERIDVTNMNLTLFTGDASNKVDTILLSPAARFTTGTRRAQGEKSVRIIRDDMEITGEQWDYDDIAKRVLIGKNVHVVFNTALPAFLK